MKYFKLLPKTNIDFIGMRKWLFIFSGILMLACFGSIIFKGMNYGIDFTGGTVMQVHFKAPINIKDIRSALSDQKINADIQTFIGKNTYAIKVKGNQDDVNEVSSKIEAALNSTNVAFDVEQKDFVGPTVGNHLAKKAFFAFVFALGAMIIYIGFRFQNIIWGAMAVLALFHDVFLAVGIFSIFGIEVDLVIVAAFLTIAGYSVNDTIVIFDRVRENMHLNPKATLKELLNLSINETLSRTIITSLTVIGATSLLFIFGGDVLRNFSLAMLIGLFSGVYSTIALVAGLVYQWDKSGTYGVVAAAPVAQDAGFTSPKKANKKRHG